MRKGKFVNTGNSDDQDNNRVDCLMNRNSIQNRSVRKFVSHSAIGKINIQTVLDQFEYIMANSPVNKAITSEILGRIFVRVATCPFWHFYILQCTLASTCKKKILIICFSLTNNNKLIFKTEFKF